MVSSYGRISFSPAAIFAGIIAVILSVMLTPSTSAAAVVVHSCGVTGSIIKTETTPFATHSVSYVNIPGTAVQEEQRAASEFASQ